MKPERWLPWALVAVLMLPYLMGVVWDAAFENAPANTDSAGGGAGQIRLLKAEIRGRAEEEHCWAAPGTGCPVTDNGFHRAGSAVSFFQTAAPTTLSNPAATALGANHAGRIWVDSDGPDNVAANADDNQWNVWDGTAWKKITLGSVLNLSSLASGDMVKYDGTNWVNTKAAVMRVFDAATLATSESFTNGSCAVDCTVANVPDHAGGSDTGNYAKITVPTTPTGVVWDIYVWGIVNYLLTSSNGGMVQCNLEQDINDADTFATTAAVSYGPNGNSNEAKSCTIDYVLRAVTGGATYSFRIKMLDNLNTADWDTAAGSHYTVEVRPRSVY